MYFFRGIKKSGCLYVANSFIMVFLILFSISIRTSNSAELQFVDKTFEAGLSYPFSPSFGLSWGDFNDDNLVDLYIRNHQNPPSLYKNLGNGLFEDVTESAGLNFTEDFHGASWGDFDNDNDSDLYQTIGAARGLIIKSNFLFRNEGDGTFIDIAESAGVVDPKGRGRTPVWFDYNHDGKLDLFICNGKRADAPSVLFRNNGADSFTDVTESARLSGIDRATGAFVADIDGDKMLDLVLSQPAGVRLYSNNGDGTFNEITDTSGLENVENVSELALGDYDNDGDVDIFVCRGVHGNTDAYEAKDDKLYYQLNVNSSSMKGLDFQVIDSTMVEFDLYKDNFVVKPAMVYIGSDEYHPDQTPFVLDAELVQNNGEPLVESSGIYIWFDPNDNYWHIRYFLFESDRIFAGGAEITTPGSMGEVYPINFEIDLNNYTNILFANLGDGRFVDTSDGAGISNDFGNASSAVFADFDNDSDLDLYVVYTGILFNENNRLYENDGQGHFIDVAQITGAQAAVQGRGESVAVADYNNDGFMDVMILNGLGGAPFSLGQRVLLANQKTDNNWIQIKLVGRISNCDGIGSIVTLKSGPLELTRQQTGGMHRASQNWQVLHFGLKNETVVDRVTVRWPSGIIQQLSDIGSNQRLTVEEPIISLSLLPDTPTVLQGGFLGVQATVTNYTNEDQSFIFASNVILPNGSTNPSPPDLLLGPQWVILAPYETKNRHITHDIPICAPLGTYIYNGYIGKGLQDIWNECHFDFTVTP